MGSIFRTFKFMGRVLAMIRTNTKLLRPLFLNVAIAAPVMAVLAVVMEFVVGHNVIVEYAVLFVGVMALYFIDYFAGGLAVSMVYDQVTTGNAQMSNAWKRTSKATGGILIFAAISAVLDLLQNAANQSKGIVADILLAIVRSLWSTAIFVVMPSMVIEGKGFGPAFSRSKSLMEHDPTQVGVGIIGVGLITSVFSTLILIAAVGLFTVLESVSILAAVFASLILINLAWAVAGYLKAVYYTCFYLWTLECEKQGTATIASAPGPLRESLDDVHMAA
jgi:hypothetical protein